MSVYRIVLVFIFSLFNNEFKVKSFLNSERSGLFPNIKQ